MNVFKRLLMLSGGGESVPYDYPDKFAFFADQAIVEPSVLEVLRPSDRLGDFTVVRASDASYTDSSGVIQTALDNVARIDYTNGVAELLTEPQSTNLITYSEDFLGTGWGGLNRTITPNAAISPDGENNASSYVSTANDPYLVMDVATTELTVTISIWMKGVGNSIGKQASIWAVRDSYVEVKSTNHVLTDQWVRVSLSDTFSAAPSLVKFRINCPDSSEAEAGDETLIWGAQLEELPYATSYIPTNGSTVTRLQDQITNGGNVNVINSDEGTMFFEGSYKEDGIDKRIYISDGTTTNRLIHTFRNGGISYEAIVNSVGAASITTPEITLDLNYKVAFKWKLNDYAIWINGLEVISALSALSFPLNTLNRIDLQHVSGLEPFFGRTRELKVYNKALPDSQLEYITTL